MKILRLVPATAPRRGTSFSMFRNFGEKPKLITANKE
jgi:hypothetical protein